MAAYSIILHTKPGQCGEPPASGVFLTLFGTKASSHELTVGREAKAPAAGEPPAGEPNGEGQLVNLHDVDLGAIRRIRVRQDPGVGPGCHVDRIVVRASGTLEEWAFPCELWLAGHGAEGPVEQMLDVLRAGDDEVARPGAIDASEIA